MMIVLVQTSSLTCTKGFTINLSLHLQIWSKHTNLTESRCILYNRTIYLTDNLYNLKNMPNQYRFQNQELLKATDKVIILLGTRQIGKTTLLKATFPDGVYINLEKSDYIEVFNSKNVDKIKDLISSLNSKNQNIWILDEVQRLEDPGLVAKVIYDEIPEIKLIISGSSALEIVNRASESLAGRKKTIFLYPLSFKEYLIQKELLQLPVDTQSQINFDLIEKADYANQIHHVMQYGLYPELLQYKTNSEKEEYLMELIDSIILKDIYYLNLVKSTKNLVSVLKLLAYQIGQLVNYSDIADRVGISRPTVVEYIELLKKSFIIFTLPPYTKKRRDEIGKTEKVFFYDLGVRNALINDFSPVEYRRDYGNMFENFVISEMLKLNQYTKSRYSLNYWRTKWGSEVDLVLTKDEKHKAIEIKTRNGKITKAFKDTYPDTDELVVTMSNVASLLI